MNENARAVPDQEPFDTVDAISMRYDICYRGRGATKTGKHSCEDEMFNDLEVLNRDTFVVYVSHLLRRLL